MEESKVSMREFLIATLEDNSKSERTIGLSDADIIEIMEQSVEFIALIEEMNKRATVTDIINFMIKKAKEEIDKPPKSGGDACCGGGDQEMTPDVIIG